MNNKLHSSKFSCLPYGLIMCCIFHRTSFCVCSLEESHIFIMPASRHYCVVSSPISIGVESNFFIPCVTRHIDNECMNVHLMLVVIAKLHFKHGVEKRNIVRQRMGDSMRRKLKYDSHIATLDCYFHVGMLMDVMKMAMAKGAVDTTTTVVDIAIVVEIIRKSGNKNNWPILCNYIIIECIYADPSPNHTNACNVGSRTQYIIHPLSILAILPYYSQFDNIC